MGAGSESGRERAGWWLCIAILLATAPVQAQAPAGTGEGSAPPGAEPPSRPTPAAIEAARQAAQEQGLAVFSAAHPEAAWAHFDAHVDAYPEDSLAPIVFARTLSASGDFDSAMAYLRHHLSRHPDSHTAALELGGLLQALLLNEEAIPYLQGVPPSEGIVYTMAQLNLGKAYRAVGRFGEAREVYTRMVDSSSRVFAEGALCEIDMAHGQLDACRSRLEAARAALGDPPALAQASCVLDYLSGDLDSAASRLQVVLQAGDASPRLSTLSVLIPLARGDVADAEGALARLEQVTVRGERDALTALVQAAAGRPDLAATAWRAAAERNPLFSDLERARSVLLWREDAVAPLRQALGVGGGTGQGSAEGTETAGAEPEPPGPAPTVPEPESGCCRTTTAAAASPYWLVLIIGLLYTRSLSRRPKPSRRRS